MKQKSFKKSIMGVLAGTICAFFVMNVALLYINTKTSVIGTYQRYGENHAERIASEIGSEEYQKFLDNPTTNQTYIQIVEKLNTIRKNSGLLYVYTLSADGQDLNIMIDGRDKPSPINSNVTATQFKDVEVVFKEGKTNSSELVHDEEFGDYISSFAPITNKDGEVLGVLGVEVEAAVIQEVLESIIKKELPILILSVTILSGIILTGVYIYLNKKLNPLSHLMKVTQAITSGNLSEAKKLINQKNVNDNNEIGALYESTKMMTNTMENMIGKMRAISFSLNEQSLYLKNSIQEVSEGAQQVSAIMEEMASSSESQANFTGSLNETMKEFSNLYKQSSLQGEEIVDSTKTILKKVNKGTLLMNDSNEQMEEIYEMIQNSVRHINVLNEENQKVSSLVGFISSIADQTNLLSLNASIEAARAGEHGRGFAVVAGEVGKLAKEVSDSVNVIDSIVKEVTNYSVKMVELLEEGLEKVSKGRNNLIQTGDTFSSISTMLSLMNELAIDMHEQLFIVTEKEEKINSSIVEVAAISEENAAGIEETSASGEEISASIESLKQMVDNLSEKSEELNQLSKNFKVE